MMSFQEQLKDLINSESQENQSNTPDFILAKYLEGCLDNFNRAVNSRDKYFDYKSETMGEPEGQFQERD